MNQENLDNYSLEKQKLLRQKTNSKFQFGRRLKFNGWNRFSYLTLTAFMLTVALTFFSSAWLPIGESFGYGAKNTNQELIIAQEESEETESELEETAEEAESELEETAEEAESELEETAEEAESELEETAEEAESELEETAEEIENESEEAESELEEAAEEIESESEEAVEEIESESREEAEENRSESREERALEKAKESLEEEIDERYEEWESAKKSSELSLSISGIAIILMTVFITVLGMEVLQIPYRRTVILVLGIITVFTQLNTNVFLLEKSLAGYKILEEQGLLLKNKLEDVETEEELKEIREQFQELILESISIE